MNTLKQAHYKYIKHLGYGQHLLLDTNADDKYPYRFEVWVNSKNHAGYGLKYKNTQLEFAHSYTA